MVRMNLISVVSKGGQGIFSFFMILCLCQNRIILRTSYYFLKDDVDHGR